MTRASVPPEDGGAAAGPPPVSAPLLASLALELDLELSPGQCATLVDYALLLRRWNRVHNLTAVDSPADLLTLRTTVLLGLLSVASLAAPAALRAGRRRRNRLAMTGD